MAAPAVAAAAPEMEAAPAPTELPAMAEPVAQPTPVFAPAPVFHAIPMPMTEPAPRPAKMAIHSPKAKPKAMAALSGEPAPAAKVKVAKAEPRVASGSHVLQLGAFLSEKNALRAKKAFLAREKSLADADVAITKATVEDRQFWRVSVSGFNANSASSKCTSIRKDGGACFAHAGTAAQPASVKVQGKALAMATPKR
jgi:hypothetical protein